MTQRPVDGAGGDSGAESASGTAKRPVFRLVRWEGGMPGVVAGFTGVAAGDSAGSESDYGLATGGEAWGVTERYEALAIDLGFRSVAVARQVHGRHVVTLGCAPERGVQVQGEADGITTSAADVLLVVTVADCVPVYMASPSGGSIGLIHAGWRGIATGILETAIRVMADRHDLSATDLSVHLGPAICGSCYEVGSDVFEALGLPASGDGLLDLKRVLAARAVLAGVDPGSISTSLRCTRCGPGRLFSHRGQGATAGRFAAFLGRMSASGLGSGG